MRKYINIIGVILWMLVSTVASAQNELNSYLKTAAGNNPGLKVKFSEYMAALQVAPQVKALPDPQIAFAYFIQPVETRVGPQNFKISASQMFPWFGTLKAKENAAIQNAKAKYEVFKEAKSKLFYNVKANYFNLYYNQKAIQETKENLKILNTIKRFAEIKVETGVVSAVDAYRIEMEIGDMENELALLKDKQNVLEVMFNNLLNTGKNQIINIPAVLWETDIPLSKEIVLDSIQSGNHQLLNLSLQQEALNFRKEVAENMGKPKFSVGVDYTFIGKGSNNMAGTDAFLFPKVGLTIPLYRNKYKAMVSEVIYLQEAKAFEKEDKENVLETVLENSWKDYQDANRRIKLYINQAELSEKSLNLLETNYLTANKDFEEVLRMERRVLKYKLELEKARADKQAAIAFVNYLIGK